VFSRDNLPPSLQRLYDLTGQGKSDKQISQETGLSHYTVKRYQNELKQRSGMSRFELIADYQYLRSLLAKEK